MVIGDQDANRVCSHRFFLPGVQSSQSCHCVWYHTGARVVSPILILCWHSYSKSKALVIYLAELEYSLGRGWILPPTALSSWTKFD
jgi:hypothetical protein